MLLKIGLVVLFIGLIIYRMLPARGVPQITTEELEKKLEQNDSQLLDVRSPREFKAYHIKGFINIPVRSLRRNLDKLDKNKELIVICHTGVRSSDACKRLKRYGYTKLLNVKGGLTKWV